MTDEEMAIAKEAANATFDSEHFMRACNDLIFEKELEEILTKENEDEKT